MKIRLYVPTAIRREREREVEQRAQADDREAHDENRGDQQERDGRVLIERKFLLTIPILIVLYKVPCKYASTVYQDVCF